ncbi:MAG TPA: peptidoglycan recognition family protein [Polyangiaceae bacterium]|nr:peptidoglycan recognition family protein [Polyangiaceae bacterium]
MREGPPKRRPWPGRVRPGHLAAAGGLVAGALGLAAFLWCATRKPTLAEAARVAAQRAELPEGLVLSVAYADGRGRVTALPVREGGRGWVRLHEAFGARSPTAGAALLGVDVARVRSEPALGLEAAARLLAAAPGAPPAGRRGEPDGWDAALRHFFGGRDALAASLYADGVLRLWRQGFRGVDDEGAAFEAAAAGGAARAPELPGLPAPAPAGAPGVPYVGASGASHRPPEKPGPRPITHLIVHTTELPFAATVGYFRAPRTGVGSHYGLRAQDGFAVQFIDEADVAFHDACFNEHSVGIEHEAMSGAGRVWFSDELYRASARLVADIAARRGIAPDREHILGHGEAPDCSDHTDPGPDWDWGRYLRYVREAYDAHPARAAPR